MKYLEIFEDFILNELTSYQQAPIEVKEFADGLKSHLEVNGCSVFDVKGLSLDDERNLVFNERPKGKNIIFSLSNEFNNKYLPDDDCLNVYYENGNVQVISLIVDYLKDFNEKIGKEGIGDERTEDYRNAMISGYLIWHLPVKKSEKLVKTYFVKFIGR
jgi:hypothetical protein